jgi:hypothetical protein
LGRMALDQASGPATGAVAQHTSTWQGQNAQMSCIETEIIHMTCGEG